MTEPHTSTLTGHTRATPGCTPTQLRPDQNASLPQRTDGHTRTAPTNFHSSARCDQMAFSASALTCTSQDPPSPTTWPRSEPEDTRNSRNRSTKLSTPHTETISGSLDPPSTNSCHETTERSLPQPCSNSPLTSVPQLIQSAS